MSYPNVIYGDYGDEKVAQSAKIGNLPLGQLMILPDGRKFRHAQAGSATALEPGAVVSGSAGLAGHGNVSGSGLLASATTSYNAVSAITVVLANAKSAVTLNQYADGWLNVQGPKGSTYIGHVYRVKANLSAATSAKLQLTLEDSDGLKVAFKSGTTSCSLRRSPYKEQIVFADGTAPPTGVTPVAASASFYFWVQTGGVCSIQQGATVCTDGLPVIADTALAGSIQVAATTALSTSVWTSAIIGYAMEGAAASCALLVDLKLE